MLSPSPSPAAPSSAKPWLILGFALVVVCLGYRAALDGPLIFDDVAAIAENASLRDWRTAFFPPGDRGLPVTGRPVANFSLALNHAAHGIAPRGYHAVNLALHVANTLLLFALVWRTLRSARLSTAITAHASWLAASIAILWAAHPLSTAAVSYISQRTELLMAFCYLATLYAFARSAAAARGKKIAWSLLAVTGCAAGMASKEVMVSAPLLALLYDRTFLAGNFRAAWRARWPVHLALLATWAVLAALMFATGSRGGTAGFGMQLSPWHYALTQCHAIVHYLQLVIWPVPLVFDYGGTVLLRQIADVWPQALLLLGLLGATLLALRRAPALGFCGAAFFAILAPTSSFVPVADTMFEHRMYLPLAAALALLVVAGHRLARRSPAWESPVLALAVVALVALTAHRNRDYRSELSLWQDTVRKNPTNARAHYTLGSALAEQGRTAEALAEYQRALELNPGSPQAHNNLANLLVRLGRTADAVSHYEAALAAAPSAEACNNLGNALSRLRRTTEARTQFEQALALRPNFAEPHNNLGNLAAMAGDFATAEKHYRAALQSRPDLADAEANLANVLAQTRRPEEALPHYEAALRLRPDFPDARMNLARTLLELRRWSEAIGHYEIVLRAHPDFPGARDAFNRADAMRAALR